MSLFGILDGALKIMFGPRVARRGTRHERKDKLRTDSFSIGELGEHLALAAANDPIVSIIRKALATWDNEADAP